MEIIYNRRKENPTYAKDRRAALIKSILKEIEDLSDEEINYSCENRNKMLGTNL